MPKNNERLSVLLVDDHAVVRTGYRTLLECSGDIAVVGEAKNIDEAYEEYARLKPDVVIMDLSMPGGSGLEGIRRIVEHQPDAKILAFTMYEDTAFAEQALQAGVRGYITKRSAPEVLVEAVKRIAADDVYMDHEVAQRLAFQKSRREASPFGELSPRELEVFTLLAEGLSMADVANRMSLSYKTVAHHSTQIKTKLNVNSAADLTRLAIRHGLIKP
jgi:DNA-binding NarL/FixJ family response regulator